MSFLKFTALCALTVIIAFFLAAYGTHFLELLNAPNWLSDGFGISMAILMVGTISVWFKQAWRRFWFS